MAMYYIGIDLGGTNVAAGLVNEGGKLLGKASVPCPRGAGAIADAIADAARLAAKKAGRSSGWVMGEASRGFPAMARSMGKG